MANTLSMRKRPKDPLPHLPPVVDWDEPRFSRRDIGEIFGGIDPSIISRDAAAIGLPTHAPIDKEGIWALYVFACYKRVRPFSTRESYVELCKTQGDAAALEFVKLAGGSREDCNHLIENFLAKRNTKPLIV